MRITLVLSCGILFSVKLHQNEVLRPCGVGVGPIFAMCLWDGKFLVSLYLVLHYLF